MSVLPFTSLSNIKKPEPPAATPPSDDSTESPGGSRAGADLLRATAPKAKSAPKMEHQEHHHVHIYRHIRVAAIRKHRVELEDEARQHFIHSPDGPPPTAIDPDVRAKLALDAVALDDRKKKKRKRRRQDEQDREDRDREDELDEGPDPEQAAQRVLAKGDSKGKYFQDRPPDRLGDLSLVDPNDMRRFLGPPVRFAQHAMLLAEDRLKSGTKRAEVIDFMASLYLRVDDRAYAHKALRDFGTGSGIIDIYPLEVVKHLLESVPSFFTRLTRGPFMSSSKPGGYEGVTGKPIVLTYDPQLRIRGFALLDGPRPGYLFEPVDPPGTYHLTFQSPGRFTVLVSAIGKNGQIFVEELEVDVKQGEASSEEARAFQREREGEDTAEEQSGRVDAEKKEDLRIHFPRRV
jgi:hypothetical protein